jgi:hypothetical protein
MNPISRIAPQRLARHLALALAIALAGMPWAASAQSSGLFAWNGNYHSQLYLGGSIGASIYSDQRDSTAGFYNASYAASTPLASGDYIATFSHQETSAFGGKVYGGAWITPNIGIEAGWASLGWVRWNAFSTNTSGSFAVGAYGSVAPHAWYESVLFGVDSYGLRYFLKAGAYEASTDLEANSYNLNTGSSYGPSQAVHNTGALVGLGIHSGYHHIAYRLEVEEFINVGQASMPLGSNIPPWRGNIVLLSAGVAYLF